MASARVETTVGGVVLAAAIGFAVYGAQITGLRSAGDTTYDLTASFRSLEGVNVGTDVRLAGVKIGSVTDIALDPDTYRAVTTVTLGTQTQIPDDSAIIISSEGLLGGNFVEVMPGGSPFYFEPGAEITDTQGAVSLVQLLLRFVAGDAQ
ncbi:MAG: outer membrane lipid asymmetry maintenance protein MlaD [Rhodobacteraceae bacterium]|nr:outer membrane lipid asymmetry maintenance protein MlaD [Paracoccaceae bacterium]